MRKVLYIFFFSVGMSCYGQTVVESKNITTTRSELVGVSGSQVTTSSQGNPEAVTTQPVGETQSYSISSSNNIQVQSAPPPELSKQEKIDHLQRSVESVEGKLFLLQGDPEENAAEIVEKQSKLEELQEKLQNLQNSEE